jgi:hypothetical protein
MLHLEFLKNTIKKSCWHLKGKLLGKIYETFEETDNPWIIRRNDKLHHIIGERNIVNASDGLDMYVETVANG